MSHLSSHRASHGASHWGAGGQRAAAAVLAMTLLPGLTLLPGARLAAEPVPETAARKVSLDFVQQDVNIVAKALSIQSKSNVVLMPSVKGSVTVRLVDLSVDEALKKMAAAVGSDVAYLEGTYFLGSPDELRGMMAKNGVKESVALKYLPAKNAKDLVAAAFPLVTAEAVGDKILVLAGRETEVQASARAVREQDLAPPAPPKPEPVKPVILRDTYTVKYAKAGMLDELLGKAIPELKVSQVERTLVLEGTDEQQKAAGKLLTALDVQGAGERMVRAVQLKYLHPHQVTLTLKQLFPNLTVGAGFESYSPAPAKFTPLGVDVERALSQQGLQGGAAGAQGGAGGGAGGAGGGGGAAGGGAGGAGGAAMDLTAPGFRSRTVILAGPAEEVEQATQVLTSNDIRPKQVVIEARMVETSPDLIRNLGLQYDWSPLSFSEVGNAARSVFGVFGRSPFGFNVTLDAREERTDYRVLAKPNIAVVDGEEASIFIGDIYRFERLTGVTDFGQTFTIEEVPIGVAMLVRPRVTEDGNIVMRVHPVVSTIRDFTGRNNDIPVTSTREADSTIMMKNGETFAFGGLLRDEDLKTLTKLPLLGDLPVIGQLFRHRSRKKNRTEVTVFLTAKIVDQAP